MLHSVYSLHIATNPANIHRKLCRCSYRPASSYGWHWVCKREKESKDINNEKETWKVDEGNSWGGDSPDDNANDEQH